MIVFHLKKVWFDKIKAGLKTHEYRKTSGKYKFLNNYIDYKYNPDNEVMIRFDLGYCKITEKEKQLFAKMKSCEYADGNKTDLKINELVYDIGFELIKEQA